MLENYSAHLPGNTIKQLLAPDTTAATPAMLSCVVGPKFLLNRYGRETVPTESFNAAGQTLTYKHKLNGSDLDLDLNLFKVDLASLRLYGVGLDRGTV